MLDGESQEAAAAALKALLSQALFGLSPVEVVTVVKNRPDRTAFGHLRMMNTLDHLEARRLANGLVFRNAVLRAGEGVYEWETLRARLGGMNPEAANTQPERPGLIKRPAGSQLVNCTHPKTNWEALVRAQRSARDKCLDAHQNVALAREAVTQARTQLAAREEELEAAKRAQDGAEKALDAAFKS